MISNRLLDFEVRELALIHASLIATAQLATQDDSAPSGLAETALTALQKIQEVIELRVQDDNDFLSLVETSLADVEKYSVTIIKNNNNNNETENN